MFWPSASSLCLLLLMAFPQDKPADPAETKPETVEVRQEDLTVKAELQGVFEAREMAEVRVDPEEWSSPMRVEKAAEHGKKVSKGDVLVEFDTEDLDRSIRDLKLSLTLDELSIQLSEEELPILEAFLPLDLDAARRDRKVAREDLERFREIDRPLAEESAKFSLESSQNYLEYAQEELEQLEKMYDDKDLTEETEEIILKRQRDSVKSAEFRVKTAENQLEQTMEVDLPRRQQTVEVAADRADLDLKKAEATMALNVEQKRLALRKLMQEYERNADKLANLQEDREAMTVHAPADGVVYYGRSEHGKWTGADQAASKLRPGGNVTAGDVFMTVVQVRPMFIRATVKEEDLYKLRPGMEATASPVGFPELELTAEVEGVSAIPQTTGDFEATLTFRPGDGASALMPGMACKLELETTVRDDVLTVPESAVFADDDDEEGHHVYKVGDDDSGPEKVAVKVGKTVGGRAEIVEGLAEGDEILASKP